MFSKFHESLKRELANNRYTFNKYLGSGSFGNVEKWTRDRKNYAIKEIQDGKKHLVDREKVILKYIESKLDLCGKNKNFILNYQERIYGMNKLYFISEALDGDLEGQKQNLNINSTYELLKIICQIIYGLYCLHKINIIHGDFKIDNIFIDLATNKIKIGDFGGSAITTSESYKNVTVSTGLIICPKLFNDYSKIRRAKTTSDIFNKMTQKSDIYAFGVTICEIIYNYKYKNSELDFINYLYGKGLITDNLINHITQEKTIKYGDNLERANNEMWREIITEICDIFQNDAQKDLIINILLSCTKFNPDERINIDDIYNNRSILEICTPKINLINQIEEKTEEKTGGPKRKRQKLLSDFSFVKIPKKN